MGIFKPDNKCRCRTYQGYRHPGNGQPLPGQDRQPAALDAQLADPGFYTRDPIGFRRATEALAKAQAALAAAEERWLDLEMLREEAAGA